MTRYRPDATDLDVGAVPFSQVHLPRGGQYALRKQKDLLGRFVGVQEFLDCNDGVLGTINQSGAREALDDVVLQLDRRAVDQNAGFVTGRGEVSRERVRGGPRRSASSSRLPTTIRPRSRFTSRRASAPRP